MRTVITENLAVSHVKYNKMGTNKGEYLTVTIIIIYRRPAMARKNYGYIIHGPRLVDNDMLIYWRFIQ